MSALTRTQKRKECADTIEALKALTLCKARNDLIERLELGRTEGESWDTLYLAPDGLVIHRFISGGELSEAESYDLQSDVKITEGLVEDFGLSARKLRKILARLQS